MRGIDPEVYYSQVIARLKHLTDKGQEIGRKELDNIIKKQLRVIETQKVIRRLKELGYIEIEKKQIVKLGEKLKDLI